MSFAIVSLGLRFPGARSVPEFWQHILHGHDLSQAVSPGRWPLSSEQLLHNQQDRIVHDRVYQLTDDEESSIGLEIAAETLKTLDPLFHMALGAGRDAFFGSQHQTVDRQRCGVILGNIALPTAASAKLAADWLFSFLGMSPDSAPPHAWNMSPAALPASVLARALGLGGGAFTLDAACASSLYAVKLACDALRSKRLDCVLAGGLSRPDSLYTQIGFSALQALSKTGRCHAFDSRADGLLVGEGAGIFVLKRLEDALAQGDKIWAVIQGAGLSNDREGRLMAPSSEGQLRAMHLAYHEAGWRPEDVQLIECHATGTPLGDKTELETLQQLWSGAPYGAQTVLGSVKPNVGHMLTAAGAAGLAKILIAMQEGMMPPTANFESLPSSWDKGRYAFRILKDAEPWQSKQGIRRAAISGFGFGGINAHLLMESRENLPYELPAKQDPAARKVVLVACAAVGSEDAAWLTQKTHSIADQQVSVETFAGAHIPYGLLRIPPTELREMLPQQLYSLLAMRKLNLPELDDSILQKMGCIVGLELDPVSNLYACRWALQSQAKSIPRSEELQEALIPPLNADRVIGALGSIVASRVAREVYLGGPSFTVSAMENSGLKALELAAAAIERGEMPAALVLAVDMPGSARGRAQLASRHHTQELNSSAASDSAMAFMLADAAWAHAAQLPILAELQSIGTLALLNDELPQSIPTLAEVETHSWAASSPEPEAASVYRGSAQALAMLMQGLEDPLWQAGQTHRWMIKGSDLQLGWMLLTRGTAPIKQKQWPMGEGVFISRRDQNLWLALAEEPEQQPFLAQSDQQQASIPCPETQPTAGLPEGPTVSALQHLMDLQKSIIASHEAFLSYRVEGDALAQVLLQQQQQLFTPGASLAQTSSARKNWVGAPYSTAQALYDYAACKEFAAGSIAKVFGNDFAEVDGYPSRVRLPDERLLLCHRVMSIEGEARSMQKGTMITEHDVFPKAWYLDDGRMPTSIAVESGQADLMLSAWLGADFKTQGHAVYRLLDARVCFHRSLPAVGSTIRYLIHIKRFFEQSGTLFFQFGFDATVDGEPLMTMTDGCAGFFTAEALAEGRGVKRSQLQLNPQPGLWTGGYRPLVSTLDESLTAEQLDALRQGHYVESFGPAFAGLALENPKTLPGGDMRLVHRISILEIAGGRYGKGRIVGEADIHADDWFLTCHFKDDEVMPGTLMYECCLHTLRVYVMRMGWVGETEQIRFEPIPGISSQLKCRGQVLADTRLVSYEIEIKEIGYGPEPYVIGDALMYADGKAIVDITDICLRIPGQSRQSMEALWQKTQAPPALPEYSYEHILAFSSGRPSDCFGESYRVFDEQRRIARLPRPPFQFLDRVEWVRGSFMKQMKGTELLAAYEPPENAFYWRAEGTGIMPFAVLLEVALQPCGFMAAYMGSALLSEQDLSFRNLSGEARYLRPILVGGGPLVTRVKSTKIAQSGPMIIQDYSFSVSQGDETVYEGITSFGYFTTEALSQQIGLRHETRLTQENPAHRPYPEGELWPSSPLLNVDRFHISSNEAGRYGKGMVWGQKTVRTDEWFFDAHFYQDPVMPGSLGLEALLQTLKAAAQERWPASNGWRMSVPTAHSWTYRGQVPPKPASLSYVLHIKDANAETGQLVADGLLYRDGLAIYEIKDLAVEPC